MLVILSVVLVVGLLLLVIWLGCALFISRDRKTVTYWASSYECGFLSNSPSFDSFSFSYFSLMVFFVVFDLEISLLLNMPFQGLTWGGFVYYYIFLCILSVGFLAEVLSGYVHWGYWGENVYC
uniref:NADH-ubiquinone oxidoreductase chain 3 n=1 Tax=Djombangia penetrans TaxID=1157998 RepID=H9YU33_9CEST|nr:NADH dehydrogenase subunit 3 [Djombangia penetrans]